MSEIQLDIPNIVVLVNNDPDYRKVIVKPDSNFNVNINVPRLVSRVSGSFIQFAETALTSSYALTANRLIDSGTLQLGYISASAMWVSESVYVGGLVIGTSSYALTASYALNAGAGAGFPYSGSAVITGSLYVIPTEDVGGITGSLMGTASIAENITVIFAGIYETGSESPIIPTPSGGLIYVTSASYANYADSVKYSNVTNKPTLVSSSTQIDYNFIQNTPTNIPTASFASGSISSSYALTASYALNLPPNIVTSSNQINSGSFSGSFVGIFTGTSSWAVSASSVDYTNITNKPTLVSASSQIIANQITGINSYATTSSNTFTGIQTISDTTNSTLFNNGALIVQGGVGIAKDVNISGSLNILGTLTVATMSTTYVTSSQYTVGTSRVIVNSDNLVRFAGISAVDSGSTYGTGSLLWDSFNNRWIYEADDQAYNSAVIIAGPKNFSSLGNEPSLVTGRVPVASGDDHIDNRPESSSIRVDFPSRLTHVEAGLQVTGSINTTTGFTGSLLGTSSNAQSSSVAISSSYAVTASYISGGISILNGLDITGSLNVNGGITGSLLGTSSWALNAVTASYVIGGGFTGSLIGTSSWSTNSISSSYALTASYAMNAGGGTGVGFPYSGSAVITGSLLISSSGLTLIGQGITGSLFGTSSYSLVSSQSRFADTASYISGGIAIENGLNITGSVNISGSLNVFAGITGSLFGTASNVVTASYALNSLSSSFATTASYALNSAGGGGGGAAFPYNGAAVITGSLLITGSGLRVTGSTDIVGALTATTKSFLIDHKKLPGKKLVYGVLEGAEHAVYTRGKLQGTNIIKLPEEWEWLVDLNTITVQLTAIGNHQKLYIKSIDGLYITVEAGGFITQEINCYYLVHATRKDVEPLQTVV